MEQDFRVKTHQSICWIRNWSAVMNSAGNYAAVRAQAHQLFASTRVWIEPKNQGPCILHKIQKGMQIILILCMRIL